MGAEKFITARKFLKWCGYAEDEYTEDEYTAILYNLTQWLGSNIDYSQFPDAEVPEEIDDPSAVVEFQEHMERRV